MGVSLNVTATPVGIKTDATLAKSGTAPPAQLLGVSQLPVVPPVHATEPSRVTLADVVPVLETI